MLKLILIMLVILPAVIAVLSSLAPGSRKQSGWVLTLRRPLIMIPIIFAVIVVLYLLVSTMLG
jgi:hypothetical protein